MTTEKVLNLFCEHNMHDKCPHKTKGTKSDPINFECICECHSKGE